MSLQLYADHSVTKKQNLMKLDIYSVMYVVSVNNFYSF